MLVLCGSTLISTNFLMSRYSRPHGESAGNLDGSRQVVFEPGTIWCLAFPLTRALSVSALSSGSLTISGRQKAADLGDGNVTEAPTGTRCRTQHDTQQLVLMNTPSCHYSPHVSESTSLCLFIHYLSCSLNKVGFVRGMGEGVCGGSDWRRRLGQQKCWR